MIAFSRTREDSQELKENVVFWRSFPYLCTNSSIEKFLRHLDFIVLEMSCLDNAFICVMSILLL